MAVSYLLNVERVRIAPSFTHGTVLRIEPPLIADEQVCDHLIGALRRLLDVLQRGDSGELLGHLMGGSRFPHASPIRPDACAPGLRPRQRSKRFAFVAHVLSVDDFRRFDPTLKQFGDTELETLRSRITEFMKPCPLDDLAVRSTDGGQAVGELIALPYLPSELVALPQDEAVELVQKAVDLGVERGAEVIGLAGFTSIVTYGGLAVQARDGVRVTSGNSYTTWSAMRAVEAACHRFGVPLASCAVAVVGATGVIGQALSLLCAERVAELILIGNPQVETSDRQTAARCRGLQAVRAVSRRRRAQAPSRWRRGAARPPARVGGDRSGNGRDHHYRHRAASSARAHRADGNECRAALHFGAPSAKWRHGLRRLPAVQCDIRPAR